MTSLRPTPPATPPEGAAHTGRALVRQARPRQWVKNVLVLAAPAAAGRLSSPQAAAQVLLALVAFVLASSATYYLNDLMDLEADRRHPLKRLRPLASGELPVALARPVAAGLLVAALAVAALSGHWQLPVVVLAYVVLTTCYSAWLKHVPAVDLVAVAGGFVLRALAGAAAVDVPVSRWFFIVTSLGSLFVVAGKRKAELRALGDEAVHVRPSHASYSAGYLGYVQATTSGAVLVSYCLWAFERQGQQRPGVPFFLLSVLPFVLGVLRYALLVDDGGGEAPEDLALRDPVLLGSAAALSVLVVLGVALS